MTPDPIQPESYKTSLEPTTAWCVAVACVLARHLWDVVDRRVRKNTHYLANQQQMIQALQREWLRNPRDLTRRLTFLHVLKQAMNTRYYINLSLTLNEYPCTLFVVHEVECFVFISQITLANCDGVWLSILVFIMLIY